MATPTEIRKGRVMLYQNKPHLVLDALHRTQGRQAGFVQVTMRNLETGASTNTKVRTTESVEFCHTETHKLEFSYIDEQGYHFMDPETFDDSILPAEICEAKKDFLSENTMYDIMVVDDKPVDINLPSSMDMKVVDAPEAVKGDTASNVQKPVTLSTGLKVMVPLFIKEGETIKINTESKEYLGRSKE